MREVDPYSLEAWHVYSQQWRALLSHLLDWDDDAIEQWIGERHERFITNSFSTHETAGWYLLNVLVPADVIRQLPGRRGTDLYSMLTVLISRQMDRKKEATSAEMAELRKRVSDEIHRAQTAESYP